MSLPQGGWRAAQGLGDPAPSHQRVPAQLMSSGSGCSSARNQADKLLPQLFLPFHS